MSSLATVLGMLIAGALCGVVLARAVRARRRGPQGSPDVRQTPSVSFDVQLTCAGSVNQHLVLSCPLCNFEASLEDPAVVGQTVVCPICDQSFEVLEPDQATASA